MNGIDISNWQNGINLAAVPFDFVICKATEGTHYVSPDCDRQIQQAIGLGKLVGVYHYVNGGNAEAEAEYFYEHCKGYVGKAAFFIDWEDKGNKAWGDTSYLKAMAERLAELLGVSMDRIGIYASKSVFPWNLTTAKTWVAQYADMNPTGYQNAPWNEGAYDCAIRQYSSCGRLRQRQPPQGCFGAALRRGYGGHQRADRNRAGIRGAERRHPFRNRLKVRHHVPGSRRQERHLEPEPDLSRHAPGCFLGRSWYPNEDDRANCAHLGSRRCANGAP